MDKNFVYLKNINQKSKNIYYSFLLYNFVLSKFCHYKFLIFTVTNICLILNIFYLILIFFQVWFVADSFNYLLNQPQIWFVILALFIYLYSVLVV